MAGKKVCIYIRNDNEKEIIKLALMQYRNGINSFRNPVLSPEQEKILDILYKEFDEIKKLIKQNDSNDSTNNNFVDFTNDFGVSN